MLLLNTDYRNAEPLFQTNFYHAVQSIVPHAHSTSECSLSTQTDLLYLKLGFVQYTTDRLETLVCTKTSSCRNARRPNLSLVHNYLIQQNLRWSHKFKTGYSSTQEPSQKSPKIWIKMGAKQVWKDPKSNVFGLRMNVEPGTNSVVPKVKSRREQIMWEQSELSENSSFLRHQLSIHSSCEGKISS